MKALTTVKEWAFDIFFLIIFVQISDKFIEASDASHFRDDV